MKVIYDTEVYPNCFLLCAEYVESSLRLSFEISNRVNESQQIIRWMYGLHADGSTMIGFNNLGFDYPIIHMLYRMGHATAPQLYAKCKAIIESEDKFTHLVYPSDRVVPQIDLFKIHHFDNRSKSTSLKKLEINMRAQRVVDLPYSPHDPLTPAQMDHVIAYMCHDIAETMNFWVLSQDQVKFRDAWKGDYTVLESVEDVRDFHEEVCFMLWEAK